MPLSLAWLFSEVENDENLYFQLDKTFLEKFLGYINREGKGIEKNITKWFVLPCLTVSKLDFSRTK